LRFPDLLTAFAAAVEENDGDGLASLFTEDGTYEDGFFGAHTGRSAIAVMLRRFHETGRVPVRCRFTQVDTAVECNPGLQC
jgi:limonene-1,2-epoxide hydrolase